MDRIGPGTLLAGRYRLAERVQDDGAGSSWRAEDSTLERPVAVTVLSADHARVQSTLDAARRAALVDDPRLQRVLGVGLEGSSGYVVLEWVTGQDAAALAGKVSEQEAVRVVTEAAEALRTAASRSLHHGRLSPRHVVRGSDGSVRVLGTAIDVAATGQATPAAAARPEARDVRDLAAVLYGLLSGRWPFGAVEGLEAAPTEKGRPVPVGQLRGDVSAPLGRLLEDTLAGGGADTLGALVGQLHDTRAALERPAPTPGASAGPAAAGVAGPAGPGAAGVAGAAGAGLAAGAAGAAVGTAGPGAGPHGAASAGDDTDVLTPVPADASRPAASGPTAPAPPAATDGDAGAPGADASAPGAGAAGGTGAAGPGAAGDGAGQAGAGAGSTTDRPGSTAGRIGAAGAGAVAAGAAAVAGAAGTSAAGTSAAGGAAAGAAAVPSRAASRPSTRDAPAPQASAPSGPRAAAPTPPVGEVRPPGYPTAARPGPVAPVGQEDDGWDLLPVDDDWDQQWDDTQYEEGFAAAEGAGSQEPQPWDSEPYDPDAAWPGPATGRESTVPVVPAGRGTGRRRPAGAGTGVVVVLLMGAFVVAGLVWALDRFRDADDVAAPVPEVTETVAPPSDEPSAPPAPPEEPEPTEGVVEVLSPAGVQALDPQGDGEENDQDAPRAIDGDPESGWTTQRYNSQDFGGLKDGLGLVFDLGEPRVVTQVLLDAPGDDGTYEIRTASGPGFDGSTVVATGETGDDTVQIVPEAPVSTQFVLVWFTSLPEVDGDWRGVVNELQVEVQ